MTSFVQVNDAPVLNSAPDNRTNDDFDSVNVNISVLFSDVDGDTLQFSATGLPGGVLLSTTGVLSGTIDSNASINSPYTVGILVEDPDGANVSGSFVWTVNNIAPIAHDDSISVNEDELITFAPLDNDENDDNDILILTIVDGPSHGTVTMVGDHNLTYDSDPDYFGSDEIVYNINDQQGGSSNGTIAINVVSVRLAFL